MGHSCDILTFDFLLKPPQPITGLFLLARLESAYSLIWGSHKIWGKGGRDTLVLL